MAGFDDEAVFGAKKPVGHVVGENVDTLSVFELDGRIAVLREEIVRLERARAQREATKTAAEAAFRR